MCYSWLATRYVCCVRDWNDGFPSFRFTSSEMLDSNHSNTFTTEKPWCWWARRRNQKIGALFPNTLKEMLRLLPSLFRRHNQKSRISFLANRYTSNSMSLQARSPKLSPTSLQGETPMHQHQSQTRSWNIARRPLEYLILQVLNSPAFLQWRLLNLSAMIARCLRWAWQKVLGRKLLVLCLACQGGIRQGKILLRRSVGGLWTVVRGK